MDFFAACWQWNTTSPRNGGLAARRSRVALANQGRASAIRAPSGGMQEQPFPEDCGGRRRLELEAAIELVAGPHEDVRGDPQAPDQAVSLLCDAVGGSLETRENHEEVVVTAGACLASTPGTEQIEALRVIGIPPVGGPVPQVSNRAEGFPASRSLLLG